MFSQENFLFFFNVIQCKNEYFLIWYFFMKQIGINLTYSLSAPLKSYHDGVTYVLVLYNLYSLLFFLLYACIIISTFIFS